MELKDLLSGVEKSTSGKEKVLKSIGKNFMALSGIARDLNVAGQNLAIVLEGRCVDPSKKQDAFSLKDEEREKKWNGLERKRNTFNRTKQNARQ